MLPLQPVFSVSTTCTLFTHEKLICSLGTSQASHCFLKAQPSGWDSQTEPKAAMWVLQAVPAQWQVPLLTSLCQMTAPSVLHCSNSCGDRRCWRLFGPQSDALQPLFSHDYTEAPLSSLKQQAFHTSVETGPALTIPGPPHLLTKAGLESKPRPVSSQDSSNKSQAKITRTGKRSKSCSSQIHSNWGRSLLKIGCSTARREHGQTHRLLFRAIFHTWRASFLHSFPAIAVEKARRLQTSAHYVES